MIRSLELDILVSVSQVLRSEVVVAGTRAQWKWRIWLRALFHLRVIYRHPVLQIVPRIVNCVVSVTRLFSCVWLKSCLRVDVSLIFPTSFNFKSAPRDNVVIPFDICLINNAIVNILNNSLNCYTFCIVTTKYTILQ